MGKGEGNENHRQRLDGTPIGKETGSNQQRSSQKQKRIIEMIECAGCGKAAKYEVYGQPHCLEHMLEAIDCNEYVEVRRIDELAYERMDQSER